MLIADDEPVQRQIVRRLVSNFCARQKPEIPFEVLHAEDGNAALQLFESHASPIHLVISDHDMGPGLEGKAFLLKILLATTSASLALRTGRLAEEFPDIAGTSIQYLYKLSPEHNTTMSTILKKAHGAYLSSSSPRPKAASIGSDATTGSSVSASDTFAPTGALEMPTTAGCCFAFRQAFLRCFSKEDPSLTAH